MKHKLALLLSGTVALSILLCGCGGPDDAAKPSASPSPSVSASQDSETPAVTTPEPSESASESQTPEPSETPSESQTPEPSETPSESQTPDPAASAPPETSGDAKETAVSMIGESVEALIAAIGEPSATDYAPSCLGSGEDGELIYDGFTVYTYREGDIETVQDVL